MDLAFKLSRMVVYAGPIALLSLSVVLLSVAWSVMLFDRRHSHF